MQPAPIHGWCRWCELCVLAYLAYCGLKKIATEVGNIEITMFMYEKSATEVYIISYNDYPSDIIELSSIDDLLAGGKDGVVSSMGITQFDFNLLTKE